jgi:PAS domain S-box-containing protein
MFRTRAWKAFGFPMAIFVVGIASTALVAWMLRDAATEQDRERFGNAVDRLNDSIRDRIDMYVAILRAGAGTMAAADIESPEQFRAFVDRLELRTRYPGVQGIGFAGRIPHDRLQDAVARQRRQARPDFEVWPTEPPRPEYYPILYLEPVDARNRAAVGYDMFEDPVRREAMERARDTGTPSASGIVELKQELVDPDDSQPGFLIYMPIYDGSAPVDTVEQRRRALRGFVYSPFRTRDLFEGVLGSNPRPRAGFELYDGAIAPESLLYRTGTQRDTLRFADVRTIPISGRTWTADFFSTPSLDESSSSGFVPKIVGGGSALTLLLTALAVLQTLARQRAEASEKLADEASRRLQQLANSMPQLAWLARPDGYIYWYNTRWYEYTGTTPEAMQGWSWQRVHDPSLLPQVVERWKQSLASGDPFEMEFPLRGADGSYRLFLTRAMPLRDSHGAILHWFGSNTDVQYRHDAARSLQEQTETLEIVNRTGAQLAGELDLDRLVQALTDSGTRLTRAQFGAFFYNQVNDRGESYTLFTLSGVHLEAFAGFPMPRNTEVFGPTFRGEGIIRSGDITADPRYGRNAPHKGMPEGHLPVRSYLAVPVKSRSGEVLGGLFFGHSDRDVFTDQAANIVTGIAAQAAVAIDNAGLYRQVQQLLTSERAARAEAERVSRLKDEFLATLSHELRTPLNAVVGWGHMLNSGALGPEKQRVAVETILRNARIQSQLIEDLLDMSRIISGRVGLELRVVDLREVVEAAVNVVRPTASAKRIDVAIQAPPRLYSVKGDANRLQQDDWNLLSNAIKFTPPDGRVTIALAVRSEQVELAVSDTGIGIEPAFLPYVFERFRQADGSYTRGHGGLGLGLSIVRSLVDMHAGAIHAWSDGPGTGSTFTLSLPAATDAELASAGLDRRDHPEMPDPGELAGLSILVVDDEADAGDLAAEVLTQWGAHVTVARSGAEALRLLHGTDSPPGLIVSDLGMPQMDGYELIRRIRALPAAMGASAPAIALTAYASAQDRSRALAAGYDLHLPKPFTPADLIAVCSRLVRTGAA